MLPSKHSTSAAYVFFSSHALSGPLVPLRCMLCRPLTSRSHCFGTDNAVTTTHDVRSQNVHRGQPLPVVVCWCLFLRRDRIIFCLRVRTTDMKNPTRLLGKRKPDTETPAFRRTRGTEIEGDSDFSRFGFPRKLRSALCWAS